MFASLPPGGGGASNTLPEPSGARGYGGSTGSTASSSGSTLPFGKHKGRTFEEVAEEDPGYCRWAQGIDGPTGALLAFVEFLRARNGGGGLTSSGGSVAGTRSVPSGAEHMGDRLGDEVTLVCELVQDGEFIVRAERTPGFDHGPGSSYVYVPPPVWRAMGEIEGARYLSARRAWLFPLARHEAVASALERLGIVERIPAWVIQLVEDARRASGEADDTPGDLDESRLPPRLLPYQLEGVRFGVRRRGRLLLGDEMGLGKTLQALSLAAQYIEDWPVLVVCPSSLRWVWKEQAEEWLPDLVKSHQVQVIQKGSDSLNPKCKFWIISYNLLAQDSKYGRFQQRPDDTPHAFVIADESHNIKDWNAARTKVLVPLLRRARRTVLLSGTPTRNAPDELHPQLCGIFPWMPAKLMDFRARYCIQRQQQVALGKTVSRVVGARNAAELNHLLTSTAMVRRLKKDVLSQLPPKRRQRIPVEVSDAKLLKEIRAEMAKSTLRAGVRLAPEALRAGDLNDFSTLAGVLEEGQSDAISSVFQKMARAKLPAVKEYIVEVLERGDEKAIIFAHHQLMMDEISTLLDKHLRRDGLKHVRVDGRVASSKRPELVRQFQEDPSCRIALLSITACSEGLTLTAAGLVVFAELYWVPGAIEQAEARAHRIGTTHNKIVVEFLVVPNSPDEYIYNALERKKKDTSHVLNGAEESLNATFGPRCAAIDTSSPTMLSANPGPAVAESSVGTSGSLAASAGPAAQTSSEQGQAEGGGVPGTAREPAESAPHCQEPPSAVTPPPASARAKEAATQKPEKVGIPVVGVGTPTAPPLLGGKDGQGPSGVKKPMSWNDFCRAGAKTVATPQKLCREGPRQPKEEATLPAPYAEAESSSCGLSSQHCAGTAVPPPIQEVEPAVPDSSSEDEDQMPLDVLALELPAAASLPVTVAVPAATVPEDQMPEDQLPLDVLAMELPAAATGAAQECDGGSLGAMAANSRELREEACRQELPRWRDGVLAVKRSRPEITQQEFVKITFRPGQMGLKANWTSGRIKDVVKGGQGEQAGLQVGWKFHFIDGQPYSVALLDTRIEGRNPYVLTFLKANGEEEEDELDDALDEMVEAGCAAEAGPQVSATGALPAPELAGAKKRRRGGKAAAEAAVKGMQTLSRWFTRSAAPESESRGAVGESPIDPPEPERSAASECQQSAAPEVEAESSAVPDIERSAAPGSEHSAGPELETPAEAESGAVPDIERSAPPGSEHSAATELETPAEAESSAVPMFCS